MQSALFTFGILPPPSSGPDILAFFYSTGTGHTANGWKALFMQAMGGNPVFLGEVPAILFAPVAERVEFHQSIHFIPFNFIYIGSGYGLLSAQAFYPTEA
jgi:hypothetical protein